MADAVEQKERRGLGLYRALPALCFLTPVIAGIAPRLSPLFLGLLGIVLIATAIRRGMTLRALLQLDAALAACLVFSAYLFVNALLAIDQDEALGKAGKSEASLRSIAETALAVLPRPAHAVAEEMPRN